MLDSPVEINAFAVFDDGSGPALFVGGRFAEAGGVPVSNVAKWDSQEWHDVGGGVDVESTSEAIVTTLGPLPTENGMVLLAAGWFDSAGGQPARSIATWDREQWNAFGTSANPSPVWASQAGLDEPESLCFAGGFVALGAEMTSAHIAEWTCVALAGDANCDELVDQFDIDPFVLALAQPAEYEARYPDCDRRAADCNADGRIDAFDIDPFIHLITQGAP